ncbi:hypothetical protein J6590_056701 [Homalodisca vitripennis]|nr:hypothetical protein J6590_102625 [Homalodisca vitripennis]KAG8306026.1 hypothetical protein J6590_056701 [Homalodisca vitripennis]
MDVSSVRIVLYHRTMASCVKYRVVFRRTLVLNRNEGVRMRLSKRGRGFNSAGRCRHHVPAIDMITCDRVMTDNTNEERHITNRKCQDSEVQGPFDKSSLLGEVTVGVGGVCSLTSEIPASPSKGVPPPAYFDWRGWF